MCTSVRIAFAAASALAAAAYAIPAEAGVFAAGSGAAIRDTVPETTSDVSFRGHGGGFRGHGGFGRRAFVHHGRFGHSWHHRRVVFVRPGFVRPGYVRAGFYGPDCIWRPAKVVLTPYGERFVPARRVCGI